MDLKRSAYIDRRIISLETFYNGIIFEQKNKFDAQNIENDNVHIKLFQIM